MFTINNYSAIITFISVMKNCFVYHQLIKQLQVMAQEQ